MDIVAKRFGGLLYKQFRVSTLLEILDYVPQQILYSLRVNHVSTLLEILGRGARRPNA